MSTESSPTGSASAATASSAPAVASSPSPNAFRPVEGGAPQRDGTVLLVEAYVAIWMVLMVAMLLSYLKQRRLDARIARLERAIDRVIDEHDHQPE